MCKGENQMIKYTLNDYNFNESEEFQDYVQERKGGKWLPLAQYINFINSCKRSWIRWINTTTYQAQALLKARKAKEKQEKDNIGED